MSSSGLSCAFIFVFSIFTKCHYTLETHPHSYAKMREEIESKNSTSSLPYDHIEHFGTVGAKEDKGQSIAIPILKQVSVDAEDFKTITNKDPPGIALEGGDVLQQTRPTTPLPKSEEANQSVPVTTDDKSHSKGSKGRKGVQYPNSSVVARKGVELHGVLQANNTSNLDSPIAQLSVKNSTVNIEKPVESKMEITRPQEEELQPHKQNAHKTHSKKPEVVSDEGDVDDFDQYSIIKTSTTGEDYVIIGIVIVIGIWFSVFGALIFYRRAGEYWDRRHYRRMDFLVEGMYND